MLPSHRKALRDLVACRTPARGGHVRECDRCGAVQYSYHSCGNRHCPKCQGTRTEQWLDAWRERLPDCPYFFLTFTLPEELRSLAQSHQRVAYGVLLRAAAESILQLAGDPGFLGGTQGAGRCGAHLDSGSALPPSRPFPRHRRWTCRGWADLEDAAPLPVLDARPGPLRAVPSQGPGSTREGGPPRVDSPPGLAPTVGGARAGHRGAITRSSDTSPGA